MTTVITKSLLQGNRFFIFRDNGIEPSFQIIKNKIETMYNLSIQEMKFIRNNYLKKSITERKDGHMQFESKMNNNG